MQTQAEDLSSSEDLDSEDELRANRTYNQELEDTRRDLLKVSYSHLRSMT